jgi:hypothetical protein
MSQILDREQNPHLASPCEGEGLAGAFGTDSQEPQHCSSPSEGEVRWGSRAATQEAIQ